MRLPNLPTALADIGLAALASSARRARPAFVFDRWAAFVLLCAASACLYLGGMVFNDYFDADEDRRERPERPIPAGEVTLRGAFRLGAALLAAGVLFALLAGLTTFARSARRRGCGRRSSPRRWWARSWPTTAA